MFKEQFGSYVCEGDTITCTVDGVEYTARLEHDWDSKPTDFECYSEKQIEAWRRDEWHFFGVVIQSSKDGVELCDHAASLWGIEGNFPLRRKNPNRYFRDVANELLPEAIETTRKQAAKMREVLALV